eukprot:CAMPEP_0182942612 /NCGR_PEP_ID=MMETSP0105_2-20130417/51009_1 /TAXON_ID=81532 ORGANISM="Acanthoeca-like sp., Strain 10tr" /NCGR_SAMPLE_ID=MMETSP0105_2 /ASSEMBLY_ACC=CAM_ASM_000205 /LENGTH=104 /DNA_ID=CAMNT_0025082365 /DNA_START=83 /DNA_END=393 /DNA_ORIENTATION=+
MMHGAALIALMASLASSAQWTVLPHIDAVTKGSVKGHWTELTTLHSADECAATAVKGISVDGQAVNVTIYSWNSDSKHCYLRYDNVWQPVANPHTISGCVPVVV